MTGPGKYDDLATHCRKTAKADGVLLCVLGGGLGSGFSIQVTNAKHLRLLSEVLRQVANQIEKDAERIEPAG